MVLQFNLNSIEDPVARESFRKLLSFVSSQPFLSGNFTRFEETVTRASTAHKIKHNLGFVPTDVMISWVSSGATVSVSYDKIDRDYVVLNVSAPCTVRFFAGSVSNTQEL